MQQVTLQERVEYASLGWRFLAVVIDTIVLFALLVLVMSVYVFVLAAQGKVDPNDAASVQTLSTDLAGHRLLIDTLFFGLFFIYYVVLEALFAASVGKLVCRMRVVMADGSRHTGLAVVVRNLVRVPEAMLAYIPSGVSCLASPHRQRLGDYAARTVVVRRSVALVTGPATTPQHPSPTGASPFAPPQPPPTAAPVPSAPVAPPTHADVVSPRGLEHAAAPPAATLTEALATLKTSALAVHGAHLNYLRSSERELASGDVDAVEGYSEEYVSAWYTLVDAVGALRAARDAAAASAAAQGSSLPEACADQPDLAHLLAELDPYLTADGDERIHEAFLVVARGDTSPA